MLGVQGEHMDSHVKVLIETRLLNRTGARWVERTILRARLEILPPSHPVAPIIETVRHSRMSTWWLHVQQIMQHFGIKSFDEAALAGLVPSIIVDGKAKIQRYKHDHVRPIIRAAEDAWFVQALEQLNDSSLIPSAQLVPPRQPWPGVLRWATWGKRCGDLCSGGRLRAFKVR